jgi:hypothetical protein
MHKYTYEYNYTHVLRKGCWNHNGQHSQAVGTYIVFITTQENEGINWMDQRNQQHNPHGPKIKFKYDNIS